MKKLIALILILVITSFVVVTKDSEPLNITIATEKSKNQNFKDKNWEYVKDRLFDGETEKVYKREGPILISLRYASKQDSLIVNEIIRELRIVIPNKTIDYFKNFTGYFLETGGYNGYNKKHHGISFNDLLKSTTLLNFNKLDSTFLPEPQGALNYRLPNEIGSIRREVFGPLSEHNYTPISILFDINEKVSYKERKTYIQYEILRTLCYINPANQFEYGNNNGVFESPNFVPDHSKFNELDKFLLQKLYSDDFIDQFKTYMYANYPWRYASSFINKKEHEFKAFSIILGMGILVFVLMLGYFQNKTFKYSYLNYLFPIFLIQLHAINLTNVYGYLTKFNSIIGWNSHIFFQIPLCIVGSVLISFVLWGLEKICLKGNDNFSYQLVLKVIFTFMSFAIPMVLIALFNWDAEGFKKAFIEFLFPYFFFVTGLAIGRGLLLYLNHFSESLVKEKDVELSRLKEAKAEAEVKVLQSQINPHFLYNALNSIASLAHTDADKTEKMALSLSDLFRHTINRKGEKVNSLEDEVNLVRSYLEIEQIRFGDRLQFSIDVEPDLLAVEIPMFMLQPLVENAIKHGISKIEGQGAIVLKINKKDNGILISVQDNGSDFPEGLVSGHGLQTVYDLLRFSYGDKAEISWHNQPKKEITIYIATLLK